MNRRTFIKSAAVLSAAGAIMGNTAAFAKTAQRQSAVNLKHIRGYNPDMQYRLHGNTGVHVSALGFGMLRLPMLEDKKTVDEAQTIEMLRYAIDNGLNYVDTAYGYLGGQSEKVVGKALRDGYRERVYLASKMPIWALKSPQDFDRMFDESRTRLQTDYLDFYLLHFVNVSGWNNQVIPFKLIEKMERYKDEGKIRFSGFSFHDSLVMFKKVVDANPAWNFCQMVLNYMNTEYEAGLLGLKYAYERGLGVNCMQPLGNSFLVNPPTIVQTVFDAAPVKRTPVEWALDYLWNMPEVGLVLSGMGSLDQVKENLEYARRSSVGMFSVKDSMVIGQAAKRYRELEGMPDCTGCYNCLPCPQNVGIGYLLGKVYLEYKATGDVARGKGGYNNVPPMRGVNASACNDCGVCVPRCPQGINIPEALRQMERELKA